MENNTSCNCIGCEWQEICKSEDYSECHILVPRREVELARLKNQQEIFMEVRTFEIPESLCKTCRNKGCGLYGKNEQIIQCRTYIKWEKGDLYGRNPGIRYKIYD